MNIFGIENGACNSQVAKLRTAGDGFEAMSEGLEGAVPNLGGIIQKVAQTGAGGEVQSEQLSDKMSVEKIGLSAQQFENSLLKLFTRDRGRIAVLNFKAVGEYIAHERKGQPCGL